MSASQLTQEIVQSLRAAQGELSVLEQQRLAAQRQKQLADLTSAEIKAYPVEYVWRSCGRMFVKQAKQEYLDDLAQDIVVVDERVKALDVKKHYLETTAEKASDGLKAVIAATKAESK